MLREWDFIKRKKSLLQIRLLQNENQQFLYKPDNRLFYTYVNRLQTFHFCYTPLRGWMVLCGLPSRQPSKLGYHLHFICLEDIFIQRNTFLLRNLGQAIFGIAGGQRSSNEGTLHSNVPRIQTSSHPSNHRHPTPLSHTLPPICSAKSTAVLGAGGPMM